MVICDDSAAVQFLAWRGKKAPWSSTEQVAIWANRQSVLVCWTITSIEGGTNGTVIVSKSEVYHCIWQWFRRVVLVLLFLGSDQITVLGEVVLTIRVTVGMNGSHRAKHQLFLSRWDFNFRLEIRFILHHLFRKPMGLLRRYIVFLDRKNLKILPWLADFSSNCVSYSGMHLNNYDKDFPNIAVDIFLEVSFWHQP